jgi:hypothetical protein
MANLRVLSLVHRKDPMMVIMWELVLALRMVAPMEFLMDKLMVLSMVPKMDKLMVLLMDI